MRLSLMRSIRSDVWKNVLTVLLSASMRRMETIEILVSIFMKVLGLQRIHATHFSDYMVFGIMMILKREKAPGE